MSEPIYKADARTGPGPYGAAADPERVAFIEKWAPVIFEVWGPHHNDTEGGVLLMRATSERDARCAWVTHAAFLKQLEAMGMADVPPCNRPAHEVVPASTGKSGDVMWIIMEMPAQTTSGRKTMIYTIEWYRPGDAR